MKVILGRTRYCTTRKELAARERPNEIAEGFDELTDIKESSNEQLEREISDIRSNDESDTWEICDQLSPAMETRLAGSEPDRTRVKREEMDEPGGVTTGMSGNENVDSRVVICDMS